MRLGKVRRSHLHHNSETPMRGAVIVRVSVSLRFRSRNKFAFGKVKMLLPCECECCSSAALFVSTSAVRHMPHQRTTTLFISDIIINSDIGVPSFIQNVYFIGVTPHRSPVGRKNASCESVAAEEWEAHTDSKLLKRHRAVSTCIEVQWRRRQ